jgi:hypothetical protein
LSRISTAALFAASLAALFATGGIALASPTAAGTTATSPGGGSTAEGAQAQNPSATIVHIARSQRRILRRGAIRVRVRSSERGRVRLWGQSRTFDAPRLARLTRAGDIRFREPGTRAVRLELTEAGRNAIRSCEPRTLRIALRRGTAQGAGRAILAKTAVLRRNRIPCTPRPIDLSRADECNFIGVQRNSLCMLPFPDDYHTVADPQTETGRRVSFADAGMPQNSDGTPIAAHDYDQNDGFSPGQTVVVRVGGLGNREAFTATDPIPLNRLSRNDRERPREPIVVIDTETGERHPIWVELDSTSPTNVERALLIRAAKNYEPGRRYIVAMRNLRNADGETLRAPAGFRYYRDNLRSDEQAINRQRTRFNRVFRELRRAGIDRADLYLAWDFTVSSDGNRAERVLHMRDDAFAQLGDTNLADLTVEGAAPAFTVDSVESFTPAEDEHMARRVQGTFEVPCYLDPNCAPGGRFELGANGLPTRNGTWTANFNCMVPRAAIDGPDAAPARPQLLGHGLLGSANEATGGAQRLLGETHNFVICATDTIGFSSADVPNIANNIVPDLSNFPELTDRVQQGMLNQLFLGRLMIHSDGFVSAPAFRVDDADAASDPVIDTARLYYNGNSQGGILGGALTAVAPDFTRASLGVPAMNYSVLLDRSVQFDPFREILEPAYPNAMTRQLVLSLIQMLWDRSDPNGYAHRMTDDPLPNTPPHEVLLTVAFGDHQVTTWQADVEARTIGAPVRGPVVFRGRWPGVNQLWDIPRIESYPHRGSAIVYWDSGPLRPNPSPPPDEIGTDPPPIENVPNRSGVDPHGDPRVAPGAMQMISDFLRPDPQSFITDTCFGRPCFAGGFTGP